VPVLAQQQEPVRIVLVFSDYGELGGWCRVMAGRHADSAVFGIALAERRQEGCVRGGMGKSAKVRARKQLRDAVMDMDDIAGLLSLSMQNVATGKMEPAVSNALGNMSRALLAIREATEVDEGIQELREQVEALVREQGGRLRTIA
jgi:hypothetical protein